MPVSEEAITKSIKNSQSKPGESRQPERDQVPSSKAFEYPTKKIKENQSNVENKKEHIGELVENMHASWLITYGVNPTEGSTTRGQSMIRPLSNLT